MKNENSTIINFIQDFKCCKLEHLQILFDRKNDNFKNIANKNLINIKNDIFIWNNSTIDIHMISALDVLCKYKKRYKNFFLGEYPNYISFLSKDNLLYKIIVADKENEQGIVKLINNSSPIIEADKLILLFKDDMCYKDINTHIPYMFCTFPKITIIK